MVRDFFPPKDSAKVLSLLFLFIAASPLLAPTIGSLVITAFGWKSLQPDLRHISRGFIGCSRINVLLLRRYSSESLFACFCDSPRLAVGAVFLTVSLAGIYGLGGTLVLLFIFLGCVGLTNPNASALAMSPFTKNAEARRRCSRVLPAALCPDFNRNQRGIATK